MWTPEILAIVAAAFLLAGFIKGVVGLGLPTVALALLTATLGLREAVALMLVPSFATNLWQGLAGGALVLILRRLWALLVAAGLGIWLGAGLSARADAALLSGMFGVLLCLYAATSLVALRLPPPGRREHWLSVVVGAVNGVITGLTGSFVVPAVPYLQSLGLPRDVLVQAMGASFTVSTVVLASALARHELVTADLSVLSVAALVPAFVGMALGQRVRRDLSEGRFQQIFLGVLLILGAYIAVRAFM